MNQAAIELLTQGDRLRREADDYDLTITLVGDLAQKYALSMQATARRAIVESHHEYALIVAFRGPYSGKLMPPHAYTSAPFERGLVWVCKIVRATITSKGCSEFSASIAVTDVDGKLGLLRTDGLETLRAKLVLVTPVRRRLLRLTQSRPTHLTV